MMRRMYARARIRLLPSSHEGLKEPMPSPCQSLLFRRDGSSTDLGVRIATDSGHELAPGGTEDVTMTFWADDSEVERVQLGTTFTLRYPVRVVAHGEVTERN